MLENDLAYSTLKKRILELKYKFDRYYKVLRQNIQDVMVDTEPQSNLRRYNRSSLIDNDKPHRQDIHPEDVEAALSYLERVDKSPEKERIKRALNKLSNICGIHFNHEFEYKVAVLAARYGDLLDVAIDKLCVPLSILIPVGRGYQQGQANWIMWTIRLTTSKRLKSFT